MIAVADQDVFSELMGFLRLRVTMPASGSVVTEAIFCFRLLALTRKREALGIELERESVR